MLLSVTAVTGSESTSDMINNLNDIFGISCPDIRKTAVLALIGSMKSLRNSYITEKNFFGAAQASLMLGIIEIKRNFFTDAHNRMKQCGKFMKQMYSEGAVIPDAENVTILTKALDWNTMVAETALLKSSNNSSVEKIKAMPMGAQRRDMTHTLILNFLKEQEIRMKQLMWNECLLIDMVCIGLAHDVHSTAADCAKAGHIQKERLKHAETLVSEHGEEMSEENMVLFESLQKIRDSPSGAAKSN